MKYLNFSKGVKGEMLAEKYLKRQKYKIIAKNYKCLVGEIDIIAKEKDVLVFVEVKYRENLNFGYPREAVTKQKQQKIKRSAEFYIMKNKIVNTEIRFDVVEIVFDEIAHIKNAF